MTIRTAVSVLAFALLGLRVASAQILLSDNFNTVASGANINGRTPVTNTINSNTWVAPTDNFLGTGAGALAANTTATTNASIDLGANYLQDNPGIYTLSLDITQPSGSTTAAWIAVGFTSVSSTFAGSNSGAPWLLYRRNGDVNVYAGPATMNLLPSGTATTTAATGVTHTFALELNTIPTAWTLNAYIDGNQIDLDAGAGMTFTYTTNPTASHFAQMGTGGASGGTGGTVDNFSLVVVPEPSTLAVPLLIGLAVCWRQSRRRKAAESR